jgi:hypothetical protein
MKNEPTTSGRARAAELIDPDPFMLLTLIMSTVTTATGIYNAALSRRTSRSQHRERRGQLDAAIHRWEANLLELKDILEEIKAFMHEGGVEDSTLYKSPVVSPLQVPLELIPDKLKQYKGLLTQLYGKAKDSIVTVSHSWTRSMMIESGLGFESLWGIFNPNSEICKKRKPYTTALKRLYPPSAISSGQPKN